MALQAALASPTNGLLERNWSDQAFKVLPIESLLTIAIVVFSSLHATSKFILIQLGGGGDQDTSFFFSLRTAPSKLACVLEKPVGSV